MSLGRAASVGDVTRGDASARARPLPLPPETRTVGQLVAETIRLYGSRFWPSLPLGLGVAIVTQLAISLSRGPQLALVSSLGALLLTASYVAACALVAESRPPVRSMLVGFVVGVVAFVPAPPLALLFVLPAIAWLALVGLAVPAAVIERRGVRASFARGLALARADYVHAVGGLATLTIIALLTSYMLFFLLRGQGEATLAAAAFLSLLVISPLLFLGAALLYFDQAARANAS